MAAELTNAQYYYEQISYIVLRPSRTINVGSTNKNSCTIHKEKSNKM